MISLTFLALMAAMTQTPEYEIRERTEDGIRLFVLAERNTKTEVQVVPSIGNHAFRMTVNGREVLWTPYATLAEYKAKPASLAIPFMAPWANRLEGDYFHANGRKYTLRAELKNFRRDGNQKPIHGLLTAAPEWTVARTAADSKGAEIVSRLAFWKYPGYMAQFPFAHELQMTYRLGGGALEVRTEVTNLSTENMPIGIGFHPYFQLAGVPRDTWQVTLPVRRKVLLSKELLPTGETQPHTDRLLSSLAGISLDDVFTDLEFNAEGQAEFRVEGGGRRISVLFGRRYPVAVVYAPSGRPFICFEPMSAITNAFNLHQEGKYPDLQVLPPGDTWRESFWIRVTEK